MSLFIHSFQLFERGVGIDFRRTDALMAQQVLDALKPCTVVQHRRGKGVTQHVGRAFLQRRHSRQVLMHDQIHLVARHPMPLVAQEQGVAVTLHLFVTHGDIPFKGIGQFCAEGHDALFVALTRHLELTSLKVHIGVNSERRSPVSYNNINKVRARTSL